MKTMLKRILVGLGGTEYTSSAIHRGVELALAHDAELSGVSVIDYRRLTHVGPVPLGGGQYATELRQQRVEQSHIRMEQAIAQFMEECAAAGVKHQVHREEGDPFDRMINLARYHDLMVFGLRSSLEFDILDDPPDALARLVTAGIRPILAVDRGYRSVHKVLIAYSGSMESAKAMKRFVQLRLWPDMQLRLVTFEDGRPDAGELIADAARYCRAHGYVAETDCLVGAPREQLLPYAAQWGADLLVVGNSAKNLLLRRVFGETALHVIRHAEQPLFLAQ
jgi:nucleotide-binding universal stress UspA family protein